MAIGLSAGPTQIADAKNPNQKVAVDAFGALASEEVGINNAGADTPLHTDAAGRLKLSEDEDFQQLVLAIRVLCRIQLAAHPHITDTLETMLADEAQQMLTDQAV